MEGSDMTDKSMANGMYFGQYGTNTAEPHEYISDPPPYEGPSIREASFLPEAPSPAPITGTGVMDPDVVMGDFLDDRIDELEKKLNECNEKLKLYEGDDDLFEDVQEEIPEIPGEVQTPSQPMKKYDYKTKGRVIIKNIRVITLQRAIENFEGVKVIQLDRDPSEFGRLENLYKRDSTYSDSSYFFRQLNSDENLYKRGKINMKTSGVMYFVIFESKEILDEFLKFYFVKTQHIQGQYGGAKKMRKKGTIYYDKNNFEKLEDEIRDEIKDGKRKNPDWNKRGRDYRWDSFNNVFTDLNLEIGIPISTIKKLVDGYTSRTRSPRKQETIGYVSQKSKVDEITIEFEDENDKREVEAMQGGGYRRKNTRRNSIKRNTRRKSRKRNTRRKSRKRNTRRKSKKKKTHRKSRKRSSRRRSKKK